MQLFKAGMIMIMLFAGIGVGYGAEDNFYAGKTIHLIVGTGAGGGFDTYSRTIARHMTKHIPGNPVIVVDNMPGPASCAPCGTFIASQSRMGLPSATGSAPWSWPR